MPKQKPATGRKKNERSSQKGQRARRKISLAEWFGHGGDKPTPTWIEFEQKHAGHAALGEDTISAMPTELINAIKLEIPRFFSKQEEQFERDLARMAGGGFFLRHPFAYPPIKGSTLKESTDEKVAPILKRMKESGQKIKQMLVDDLEQHGRSPSRIEDHFATKDKIGEKIEARKWGYAAWLVTNPEFQKEWAEVRKSWEPSILAIGGFPSYPTDFTGHSPVVPEDLREFYGEYTQFYQRWCIHTFVTWDLPVPMLAGIATPIFYPLAQVSAAGMASFIPWYLLRDQTFKLQDLAKHERFAKGPDHLQGWFKRDRNRWGHKRLGIMLRVYVFTELCLKKRYQDRVNRQIEELDYAFCRFLYQIPESNGPPTKEVESIKKIRQELSRRLKSCFPRENSD